MVFFLGLSDVLNVSPIVSSSMISLLISVICYRYVFLPPGSNKFVSRISAASTYS
ncbi:hypothetical protein BDZ91DRAFT_709264 [Kalaharituber pfeilii]|nr:hypothetical protein BDZ91DRAFT_709264 [Kalaharituber pfeilii]